MTPLVAKVASVTTAAMAVATVPLFVLGGLAPDLVDELGIDQSSLGWLVAAAFGVAAVLSLGAGPVVAGLGARRSTALLFLVSAVVLTLVAYAPAYGVLLAAVALSGVPQALANPATNLTVAAAVPKASRPAVVGVKQSGVQAGALLVGGPVALVTAAAGHRAGILVLAGVALVGAAATWLLPADPAPPARPRWSVSLRSTGEVRRLALFACLLGAGNAAVSTFAVLYAVRSTGFDPGTATALVAVFGATGVAGRVLLARYASPALLAPLGVGAAAGVLALWLGGTPGAWIGMAVVGLCSPGAWAVVMARVVASSPPERTAGHSSLAAAGFYAGFALGPSAFGALSGLSGYPAAWGAVAGMFLAAGAVVARARWADSPV